MLGLVLAVGITLLITYRLGATFEADAFIMARRLITGLTELMHRAMLMIFIPVMAAGALGSVPRQGPAGQGGRGPAADLSKALAGGLALLAAVWFLTPPLIDALGGTMAAGTRALTIWTTRAMALAIPAVVLANLATATLNLRGVFGAPALLRLLPRVFILAAFGLAAAEVLVKSAAAAFVAGNLALLAGCLWLMRRPYREQPRKAGPDPVRPPRGRGYVGAALLMIAGAQAVSLIEIGFAVRLGEGALTVLELAQRVTVVVAGAFISAAVAPFLARWSREPEARSPASFGRALRTGLMFLGCVQGFFLINAQAVVTLLFGQSLLDPAALREIVALMVVAALAPLAVYVSQLLAVWNIAAAAPGLVRSMSVSVLANLAVRVGLALALMPRYGLVALALGMVAGPAAAALSLARLGDRGYRPDPGTATAAARPLAMVALVLAALGLGHWGGAALAVAGGAALAPLSAAVLTLAGSGLAGAIALGLLWRRFGRFAGRGQGG